MGVLYSVLLHPLTHTSSPLSFQDLLSPLLSNVLFNFRNFFFRPFIVSLISTNSSACKTSFIKPSFAFSVTTSTTIANNKGDKTDP